MLVHRCNQAHQGSLDIKKVISQSPNFCPTLVSPVHRHHHLFGNTITNITILHQHEEQVSHLVIDGDTLLLARHGAALLVIDRGALLLVGCLALLLRCARAFSLCHCLLGGAFVTVLVAKRLAIVVIKEARIVGFCYSGEVL